MDGPSTKDGPSVGLAHLPAVALLLVVRVVAGICTVDLAVVGVGQEGTHTARLVPGLLSFVEDLAMFLEGGHPVTKEVATGEDAQGVVLSLGAALARMRVRTLPARGADPGLHDLEAGVSPVAVGVPVVAAAPGALGAPVVGAPEAGAGAHLVAEARLDSLLVFFLLTQSVFNSSKLIWPRTDEKISEHICVSCCNDIHSVYVLFGY